MPRSRRASMHATAGGGAGAPGPEQECERQRSAEVQNRWNRNRSGTRQQQQQQQDRTVLRGVYGRPARHGRGRDLVAESIPSPQIDITPP